MSAATKYMSIKSDDVIRQLKRNKTLNRSSKIRLLRQGNWELLLLAMPNKREKMDMYAIHYKTDNIDYRRSGYIQVYKKDDTLEIIFNSDLPKYIEQKILIIAKALDKEGYNIIIK